MVTRLSSFRARVSTARTPRGGGSFRYSVFRGSFLPLRLTPRIDLTPGIHTAHARSVNSCSLLILPPSLSPISLSIYPSLYLSVVRGGKYNTHRGDNRLMRNAREEPTRRARRFCEDADAHTSSTNVTRLISTLPDRLFSRRDSEKIIRGKSGEKL